MLLVTLIFGNANDVDEPLDGRKVLAAVRKAGPAQNFTYNVLSGCMADAQL